MEISDEEKLILNGEMFFSIRKCLRQKKSTAETIKTLDRVVNEGADINACDSNDNNNTILHIAAQKCAKDLVIHILQKGARLIWNQDKKTPVDLALQTNTAIGKEIADILSKQDKTVARVTSKNISKQQIEPKQCQQNNSLVRAESVQEVIYPKRAGTSGVSGQFYETKLLSLVLHRALHDKAIEDFYLAANIKDIGDFDDVCFRYGNVACFMQTKHRENTDKAKLTVASVRSTTGKLGLGIYFDSFLKIRKKFILNSTDPMFQGKFEDMDSYFVLYTPLKESFERKLSGIKQICNKLHDIIYTSENDIHKSTDIFQFNYEDRDLDFLTKFIKQEHMKVLAKTFLEFILSDKKLEVMMANDLVKIYHPALAQKVVTISKVLEAPNSSKAAKTSKNPNDQNNTLNNSNVPSYIHMGMFRPEFFTSEDPNLVTLKDTFYKEIVYTHSSKTTLSKDDLKKKIDEIASNPCDNTISTLIGCPIKFDETNDKLSLDISKLPKNKYKQDEIQQIKYDLQKIQVTRAMVKDAVYLAGQTLLQNLTFKLPLSFGNIDLTTNKKTRKDVEERLDFLADKFNLLINYFAERNKGKEIKIIDISSDVVGPHKILELSHLNSNGGIGGSVGNLLEFHRESELFTFKTNGELGENAKYILEKIKGLTKKKEDEDLANYRINVMIDDFPRVSFDTYQYDKNIAGEFLSKLWFYTNQAQEESVETTIKKEINVYYNTDKQQQQFLFHVHSDAIFLRFHDEVQKWWKKQTEAHYITKNTTIYEKAKKDIVDSPLLTVLNVMFIRKIKHLSVEFNEDAIDSLKLNEFMQKNKILNIVSDAVILTASKIMQSSKYTNNYSFINLDYVHILPQNDYATMIDELKVIKDTTLVIISETHLGKDLKKSLLNVLNACVENFESKKRIIIITGDRLQIDQTQFSQCFGYKKDNNVKMIDLTLQSQTNFLNKYTINYQGQVVRLNTLLDDNSKKLVNAKVLWSFLNKEKMEIGLTLDTFKYNEIKNYYINRNLKRDDEEYAISTLDDIDDRVVLISSKPCMGKSILLTHLSLETKKVNPKPWIVRINMSNHDKELSSINLTKNTIINYLCKVALVNAHEIEKVDFREIDEETVAINMKDDDEGISFELQFFIHCYNSGNIVFLFDGFDKIYPQNTNEGLQLFTALNNANKRMWITSDCYIIKVLEDKFGESSYKLERLSTIQQNGFLQRFWTTNLKLEKLNHEQFNNIALFLNYIMRVFNRELQISDDDDDRPVMPLLSVPLHIIYLSALEYFKNEVHNLSPRYLREKIKQKWRLNRYSAVDRYLGRSIKEESLELAATPLHMYIAANYFVFQITDKFDLHLDTKMIYDRLNVYINAVTLYERLLKVNIKHICEIEDKAAVGDRQKKLRDNFFDRHKKLAVYAICKESDVSKFLTKEDICEVQNTVKMIESGAIKTDLIDSVVNGVPRFYHLLFAEYFIVETLSDLLIRIKNQDFDNIKLDSFWNFLVNVILVSSPPSLRNAFDYKLKYDPELAEVATNENCRKVMFNLLMKPNAEIDGNASSTDNALNIAINEGLVNLTDFLLKGIQHNINENNLGRFMTILKGSATILSAADTSRSIVSDTVLNCILNVDGETVVALLNSKAIGGNVEDIIKSKFGKPVLTLTEKIVEFSGNHENLVNLMTQIPNFLVDFVRQFYRK